MPETNGGFHDVIDGYVHPRDSAEGRATALATLRCWTDAVASKDIDTLRALMTDDIVIELPFNESGRTDRASYRIYEGVAQCTAFWQAAFAAEGVMHAPSEVELTMDGAGTRLFLECRGHLTMVGGREYRNRYVMRLDVAEGRVSHCKEYYNPIQSAFAFGRPIANQFRLDRI